MNSEHAVLGAVLVKEWACRLEFPETPRLIRMNEQSITQEIIGYHAQEYYHPSQMAKSLSLLVAL